MKKICLVIALSLIMVLAAGCGASEKPSSEAPSETSAETSAIGQQAPSAAQDESAAEPSVTVASLGLADGQYQVEVTLSGGSGRAGIDSPALLRVDGGKAYATIVWSSPNYDYMLVDGEKYDAVITDGHSTFEIPVSGFDWAMPVTADTVAMSVPHEIDYTLELASSSIAAVKEAPAA